MTEASKLPLAITMGDPSGCGPKITAAAWRTLHEDMETGFYVIGDPALYDCPTRVIEAPEEAGSVFSSALPVLDLLSQTKGVTPGQADPALAPAILESIERATGHALDGSAAGVVTNPISKSVLYRAGFSHPGHTEFLAALCESHTGSPAYPVMMLVGGGLRVALATIHVPLMQVAGLLSEDLLTQVAQIVERALKRDFGISQPRIAFAGLNPHAGEDGTIGLEERDLINPAATKLRASGIEISNARPGDTVFAEMLDGRFDAVIAMTHDQGLIPVKTLDFWGGVNTTLGLPIIRTSPDHGTAYDAARDGTARPDSLIAAIRLASEMVSGRGRHV
ncbi:MAG: 4-hydroxythreonine-4-phosphate dehydrogenase PdxA [Henriciella sp.]|uniref:4-hydroxythreonine-4-phosphate dehydrogenase PdxA n=1 Tax=Henriciella sp. TaxID=1968823 RepID=UPI003C764DFC